MRLISYCLSVSAFFFFAMFKFCLFVCTLSARCTVACSCKITKVEYNLLIHLEIYIYIYIYLFKG